MQPICMLSQCPPPNRTWEHTGYSRANSPPLSVTLATLRIFANHYPERLEQVIFVDAPAVFSLLCGAIKPFVDPVTARKVRFVKSPEFAAAAGKAGGSSGGSGSGSASVSGRSGDVMSSEQLGARPAACATATADVTAVSPSAAAGTAGAPTLADYWPFYAAPFDAEAYQALLARVWGPSSGSGSL